jgi:hypothetical protein
MFLLLWLCLRVVCFVVGGFVQGSEEGGLVAILRRKLHAIVGLV